MALLRLPHQTPLLSLQNLHSQSTHHHNHKNTGIYFSGSLPHLSPLSQTFTCYFPVKARKLSTFILRFCATTQNPVLELQSESEQQEGEEEFSRTRLIAQNVPWTCTPEDIRSLFEKHGAVLDVELSMYNKIRNRGLAFVTMGSPEEALAALNNLESYELEGRTLKLSYARPKKEKPVQPRPVPLFNLFVANLSYEARDKHLKEFFISEGSNAVSAEVIYHDNPRRPSGYGFVAFKSKKEAEAALSSFQGKIFMGRPIRVARSRQFVKVKSVEGTQSDDTSTELNSGTEQADKTAEN